MNRIVSYLLLIFLIISNCAVAGNHSSTQINNDVLKAPIIALSLVIFLATLLFAILIIFYRKRSKLLKINRHLKSLLFQYETDKELLANELHNNLGQNVLYLRNQLVGKSENDLVEVTDDSIQIIRTLSSDLYPVQLRKFGLKAALISLTENIAEKSNVFISYDLDHFEEALNKNDEAIFFYRLVDLCLTEMVLLPAITAIRLTVNRHCLLIQNNASTQEFTTVNSSEISTLVKFQSFAILINSTLDIEKIENLGSKYIFKMRSK